MGWLLFDGTDDACEHEGYIVGLDYDGSGRWRELGADDRRERVLAWVQVAMTVCDLLDMNPADAPSDPVLLSIVNDLAAWCDLYMETHA